MDFLRELLQEANDEVNVEQTQNQQLFTRFQSLTDSLISITTRRKNQQKALDILEVPEIEIAPGAGRGNNGKKFDIRKSKIENAEQKMLELQSIRLQSAVEHKFKKLVPHLRCVHGDSTGPPEDYGDDEEVLLNGMKMNNNRNRNKQTSGTGGGGSKAAKKASQRQQDANVVLNKRNNKKGGDKMKNSKRNKKQSVVDAGENDQEGEIFGGERNDFRDQQDQCYDLVMYDDATSSTGGPLPPPMQGFYHQHDANGEMMMSQQQVGYFRNDHQLHYGPMDVADPNYAMPHDRMPMHPGVVPPPAGSCSFNFLPPPPPPPSGNMIFYDPSRSAPVDANYEAYLNQQYGSQDLYGGFGAVPPQDDGMLPPPPNGPPFLQQQMVLVPPPGGNMMMPPPAAPPAPGGPGFLPPEQLQGMAFGTEFLVDEFGNPIIEPMVLDEFGNPIVPMESMIDEFGNPIMESMLDEFGNPMMEPMVDEFGNPIVPMEPMVDEFGNPMQLDEPMLLQDTFGHSPSAVKPHADEITRVDEFRNKDPMMMPMDDDHNDRTGQEQLQAAPENFLSSQKNKQSTCEEQAACSAGTSQEPEQQRRSGADVGKKSTTDGINKMQQHHVDTEAQVENSIVLVEEGKSNNVVRDEHQSYNNDKVKNYPMKKNLSEQGEQEEKMNLNRSKVDGDQHGSSFEEETGIVKTGEVEDEMMEHMLVLSEVNVGDAERQGSGSQLQQQEEKPSRRGRGSYSEVGEDEDHGSNNRLTGPRAEIDGDFGPGRAGQVPDHFEDLNFVNNFYPRNVLGGPPPEMHDRMSDHDFRPELFPSYNTNYNHYDHQVDYDLCSQHSFISHQPSVHLPLPNQMAILSSDGGGFYAEEHEGYYNRNSQSSQFGGFHHSSSQLSQHEAAFSQDQFEEQQQQQQQYHDPAVPRRPYARQGSSSSSSFVVGPSCATSTSHLGTNQNDADAALLAEQQPAITTPRNNGRKNVVIFWNREIDLEDIKCDSRTPSINLSDFMSSERARRKKRFQNRNPDSPWHMSDFMSVEKGGEDSEEEGGQHRFAPQEGGGEAKEEDGDGHNREAKEEVARMKKKK
ncbi:unnamed protein product [Amoebophrya sp. A120]|nr:unnamed protein product [Amoebophrya sp. A120]|eukprot:GSA120T00004541001.1